jgi:branched-chain amino acid transport system ATP-binding protein
MLMSLRGVSKRFGALTVLNDISVDIEPGEILGIAGPNGAGKSTLLNACTGLFRPDRGQIHFKGQRTERCPPHRLCHMGLARTFQIPQVFESLSVEQNIETGGWFGTNETPHARQERTERILELLGLAERRHAPAATIDLYARKMVMLGAALATDPSLIFMDEPFGGLNGHEIDAYADLVLRLRQELGVAFVIVEHKIRALARLSSRLMILNFGHVLCLGTVAEVLGNAEAIDIYFGTSAIAAG